MRCHIRSLYLALAIILIFLSHAQSQGNASSNCTAIPEQLAMIAVSSEVYETNSSAIAVFGNKSIEPAKQEIYKINLTNKGEVPLSDVIVSIAGAEGMIFKNIADYDNSGYLQTECTQHDLCMDGSSELMRNLGTFKPNETKSILINAYIRPEVEKTQINITAIGIKPNGSVSDTQDSAELAKCIVVCNNEINCDELIGGCICKRPEWTDESIASDLSTKPRIELKEIKVTNTISAIKTANQIWSTSNMGNIRDIKSYIPNVADEITYQIGVSNTDDINSLKDVTIVDRIPDGMVYRSSSLKIGSIQILPEVRGNNITWSIDEIGPNTMILFNNTAAFLNNDLKRFENRVYAKGTWDTKYALIDDQSQIVSSVTPA